MTRRSCRIIVVSPRVPGSGIAVRENQMLLGRARRRGLLWSEGREPDQTERSHGPDDKPSVMSTMVITRGMRLHHHPAVAQDPAADPALTDELAESPLVA